jgi:D-alanine transaminase
LVNQKAKDAGFDDAIFVRDGFITEATYANVFIVDDSQNLITHPANNHILCGITRNRLIKIAQENNINVIEKKFGIDEMMNACEVFLTSSTLIIRPVFQINGQEILGRKKALDPSLAKTLKDTYESFIVS